MSIIILPLSSYCQTTNQESGIKGNVIIGIGSTLNVHRYAAADNRIYKEVSLDYGINNFMSIGLYAGHQRRNYLYLNQKLIRMDDLVEISQFLDTVKNSSIVSWHHINMQGEYDFLGKNLQEKKRRFDLPRILNFSL